MIALVSTLVQLIMLHIYPDNFHISLIINSSGSWICLQSYQGNVG
jgi:hypothetical protein